MKNIVFFVCILLCVQAAAQKISGTMNVSVMNGKSRSDVALNGGVMFPFKDLSVGLTAGVDHYLFRSAPIMINAKRSFGKKLSKPFVFANAGYNVAWVSDKQRVWHWDAINTPSFRNGYIWEAGIGYGLTMKNKRSLDLSIGRSEKSLNEVYKFRQWNGTAFIDEQTKLQYIMRRLAVKAAINF